MLIICLGISCSLSFYTTASNTTGGNLKSDTNRAIARSKATHAKEEKALEIKLQEEIDEAKRISLGVSGGNCE